jgi:hypothetical protein
MWVLATPAFIAELIIVLTGGTYLGAQPPMTELQSFIYYEIPAEADEWVYWQRQGAFAGHEQETRIGQHLLLFRDELRRDLVESRRITAADFESRYGTDSAPNFCAISKATIAATFAVRHGGAPADYDVAKHSRCEP